MVRNGCKILWIEAWIFQMFSQLGSQIIVNIAPRFIFFVALLDIGCKMWNLGAKRCKMGAKKLCIWICIFQKSGGQVNGPCLANSLKQSNKVSSNEQMSYAFYEYTAVAVSLSQCIQNHLRFSDICPSSWCYIMIRTLLELLTLAHKNYNITYTKEILRLGMSKWISLGNE